MIAKGFITKRSFEEGMQAPTIERDYLLAQMCAEIGGCAGPQLVFKGGTLLRTCYFADYRYSADLDFSAIDGLTKAEAVAVASAAVEKCRARLELPVLEVHSAMAQ
jgi:predicted nucleotidyltransferase component of viral defense system